MEETEWLVKGNSLLEWKLWIMEKKLALLEEEVANLKRHLKTNTDAHDVSGPVKSWSEKESVPTAKGRGR
jgi:hypothetical protein